MATTLLFPGLTILGAATAVLAIVLLAGLVAGQFRRGVVDELRATLATAKTEIDVERLRSDRLEREAGALRTQVAGLVAEVATLRSVLTDERKVAAAVSGELKEALGMQTARIVESITKLVEGSR